MKNLLIALLAFAMIFSLIACDGNEEKENGENVNLEEKTPEAEFPEGKTELEATEPKIIAEDSGDWHTFLKEYESFTDIIVEKYKEKGSAFAFTDEYAQLMEEMVGWHDRANLIIEKISLDEAALTEFCTEYYRIMNKLVEFER